MRAMKDQVFEIGAQGVDPEKIEEEIRAAAKEKEARGAYKNVYGGRLSKTDLQALVKDGKLLRSYMDALRENVFVDITDFEIDERRSFMPGILVAFKRSIWKLLRFYTYRMWSQQNEINGLLMSSIETMDKDAQDRLKELQTRIESLEKDRKQ